MIPRKLKCKKCKNKLCGKEFIPVRPLQYLCGEYSCTLSYANAAKSLREYQERMIERRLIRVAREKAKPRSKWLKEVQAEFNKFIRMRDAKEPCISCGRFHSGQYHCGHFRSVGSSPELRFEESNAHKQCSVCNNHLSGNLINFRISLIRKIGIEKVDWLEGHHEPKKYTIDELIALKAHFKQLYKELQHASS